MSLLAGIPISDEQCIGDSLDTINNSFVSLEAMSTFLSGGIDFLSFSLDLSSSRLISLIQELSASSPIAKIQLVNTNNFVLSSNHNNHIIFLNSGATTTVTRASAAPFEAGHKTTFVQTGSGTVTFNGFNSKNSFTRLEGRYGVAEVFYANNAALPFRGWTLHGDIISIQVPPPTPEPFGFSLVAEPQPGAEDTENQITLTGPRPDTIYYYRDPESNLSTTFTNIFVNGYYRTTTDFTVERVGTRFGYRVAGFKPNTTGPQASGLFVDGGNVFLNIADFNPEPTYISLSSNSTTGNEDSENDVGIIAQSSSFDGESIFYFADPDPAGTGGAGQAVAYVRISTDGGLTWSANRHLVDYELDRAGQLVGFKRKGVVGGPEATTVWPNQALPNVGFLDFIVGGTPRPTPTVGPTSLPTTPAPTPTLTRTPTPTLPPNTVSLIAAVSPGNEDLIHNLSFVSTEEKYNDTLFYYSRTLEDYAMESPMIIYVNGVRRTTVEFPNDFTGTQFGYRLRESYSTTQQPQAYGTFAPGRVDLTINYDQTSLTASVAPGSEDVEHGISITSDSSQFDDTIFYFKRTLEDFAMENPMVIYVNGIRRTVVEFPNDFTGTTFGYRLKGVAGNPQAYGTFAPGRVDLTIVGSATPTPTPTLGPTPTPMPTPGPAQFTLRAVPLTGVEDPITYMAFTSVSAIYNDTITYNQMQYSDLNPTTMSINLSGVRRTVIEFPDDRLGTQFNYRVAGILDPNRIPGSATLTFVTGVSDLSTTNIKNLTYFGLSANSVGNEDIDNVISIRSLTTGSSGDSVWYYRDDSPDSYAISIPMNITINGGATRTVVEFPDERLGTPFGYSRVGVVSAEVFGIFRSGTVNLVI